MFDMAHVHYVNLQVANQLALELKGPTRFSPGSFSRRQHRHDSCEPSAAVSDYINFNSWEPNGSGGRPGITQMS